LNGYVTICVTKASVAGGLLLHVIERFGRRGRTRTCDHLLRRQVLYPPELRARAYFTITCGSGLFAGDRRVAERFGGAQHSAINLAERGIS
jgi:hypothetical protein